MPIEATQNWFAYYIHGTGGADITNQFLSYGIAAGLGSMGLFIFLLIRALISLGAAQQALRDSLEAPSMNEYFLWGLGVMIIVHIFNWIGINYFDQTYAIWYLQLAAVAALTEMKVSAETSTSDLTFDGVNSSNPPQRHYIS